MQTRAVVLYELNKPLIIEEIEIPELSRGQVLVKILATGICRAQLNEVKGLKGPDRFLPHLLGHEAAGEVVKVGEKVEKVEKGDTVVVSWIKGKGLEGGPVQYKLGNRIINAGEAATFTEYAVISENRLTPIPSSIPLNVASILGCAIPTGVGIIRHTLKVTKGSSIAIFGVGGIGASALLGAKMVGCNPIIAVDINNEKLVFAKELGATHTINFLKTDVMECVRTIVRDSSTLLGMTSGVDFAVEASGNKSAMETAFEVLHEKGKLAIAGNIKKGEKICIVPFDLIKGKQIVGTWGGESKMDQDVPYYVKQYLSGSLLLDKLIGKKVKLDKIIEALSEMEKNDVVGRMVIEF